MDFSICNDIFDLFKDNIIYLNYESIFAALRYLQNDKIKSQVL